MTVKFWTLRVLGDLFTFEGRRDKFLHTIRVRYKYLRCMLTREIVLRISLNCVARLVTVE